MTSKDFCFRFFVRQTSLILCGLLFIPALGLCQNNLKLWYKQPAQTWYQALPIGNGSLGGMVFGGVNRERIQLNEESLWTGHPVDRENPEARAYIDSVRYLLFANQYEKAQKIAQQKIMGKRLDVGKHTYQHLVIYL